MSQFEDLALRLVRGGYTIVPIEKGSKAVRLPGWRHIEADEDRVKLWASSKRYENIGINTRNTPAVDIDVYDADVAADMEKFILERIDDAPVRVGRAPKRLLVFRTNSPFRKMSSTWTDGDGQSHKIEILGDGQQFVAYGIHPDTGLPYTWTSLDQPIDTPANKLPLLTVGTCQKILDYFDKICEAEGWTRGDRTAGGTVEDADEDIGSMKRVLAITEETVVQTLDLLDNDDADYDDWLEVGMALHHQFQGGTRGLELWHEWGERSSKYVSEETNRKYESFGHGSGTITFATLLFKAERERERRSDLEFDKLINRINPCNSERELTTKILKEFAEASLTEIQQDEAVKRVQLRLKELKQLPVRLEAVKKMFNALKPRSSRSDRDTPKWCEHWVYLQRTNSFYNSKTGLMLSSKSFDGSFGKHLLTDKQRAEGMTSGGKASDAALNLHDIPQVFDTMYMPGMGPLFTMDNIAYVNQFTEHSVPAARAASSDQEKRALKVIKKHFEVMFPIDEDRRTLIDYLAYNVQYPGQKITWAIVIQGVSGAGKTWFHRLMAEALGMRNCRAVTNKNLRENFTGWARGHQMVFFEEINLADDKKFQILENLLTYVGNKTADIRNMQRESYEIPNVTNYVMFTMYINALPLEKTDRRYYVMRTSLQTKDDIERFNAENPGYYNDIYDALEFNGDIIRHWLMNHPISDAFEPSGRAPDSISKDLMRAEAGTGQEELSELETLIASGESPMVTDEVLSSYEVKDRLMLNHMPGRAFGKLMADAGFTPIGKFRIHGKADEPLVTYYTRKYRLYAGMTPFEVLTRIRDLIDNEWLS